MNTKSSASNPDIFSDYEKPTVFHRKFQEAFEKILAFIFGPITQNLIILIGPTGVGKTWLVRAIVEKLANMKSHAISFEAFPPLQSTSPFRGFFEDYQRAIADPFTHKPRSVDHIPKLEPDLFPPRSTLDILSRVVCDRVRKLSPSAVFVDEANVFADLSPAQTEHSLKLFKALANQTQIPHVLVGTEALLNFIGLDSQLQRRGRVIHLDTYSTSTESEKKDFIVLFNELMNACPIKCHYEMLHETQTVRDLCFGAPGILADLILDACKLANQRKEPELLLTDLQSVAVDNYSAIIEEQETIRRFFKRNRKPRQGSKARSGKKAKKKHGRVQRTIPKQYPVSK